MKRFARLAAAVALAASCSPVAAEELDCGYWQEQLAYAQGELDRGACDFGLSASEKQKCITTFKNRVTECKSKLKSCGGAAGAPAGGKKKNGPTQSERTRDAVKAVGDTANDVGGAVQDGATRDIEEASDDLDDIGPYESTGAGQARSRIKRNKPAMDGDDDDDDAGATPTGTLANVATPVATATGILPPGMTPTPTPTPELPPTLPLTSGDCVVMCQENYETLYPIGGQHQAAIDSAVASGATSFTPAVCSHLPEIRVRIFERVSKAATAVRKASQNVPAKFATCTPSVVSAAAFLEEHTKNHGKLDGLLAAPSEWPAGASEPHGGEHEAWWASNIVTNEVHFTNTPPARSRSSSKVFTTREFDGSTCTAACFELVAAEKCFANVMAKP